MIQEVIKKRRKEQRDVPHTTLTCLNCILKKWKITERCSATNGNNYIGALVSSLWQLRTGRSRTDHQQAEELGFNISKI